MGLNWNYLHLLIDFTSMVTLDMEATVPVAGLMVNSMGRAWRPLAALACQVFLDMSNNCSSYVTLGEPNPSPRTRSAKVIGTAEVLNMENGNVFGKPSWKDLNRGSNEEKFRINRNKYEINNSPKITSPKSKSKTLKLNVGPMTQPLQKRQRHEL